MRKAKIKNRQVISNQSPVQPLKTLQKAPVVPVKKKNVIPMLMAALLLAATLISLGMFVIGPMMSRSTDDQTLKGEMTDVGYVIPMEMISKKATFYPMKVDNVKVEIVAVMASDNTIRTAFNTCQVCYSSGRGYYKWINGMLVCQNCGNQFLPDQVEVVKGGCNPVPIYDEETLVENGKITVPIDYLKQAIVIFKDWKF